MYAITIRVKVRDDDYKALAEEVAELRLPEELITQNLTDKVFAHLFSLAMEKAKKEPIDGPE